MTAVQLADTVAGPQWVVRSDDGPRQLGASLGTLLSGGRSALTAAIEAAELPAADVTALRTPLDLQEVWASGVTYELSRDARVGETSMPDAYMRVYDAERPELFLKCGPNRLPKLGEPLRIRHDSAATIPEPELGLLCDSEGAIVGALVANDLTARDIEGENPLYLPQAKIFTGGLALSDSIVLVDDVEQLADLQVECVVERAGEVVFAGETSTGRIRRRLQELVDYLFRALEHPAGVVLLTGTGIVPPDSFSLQPQDKVRIAITGVGVLEHDLIAEPAGRS